MLIDNPDDGFYWAAEERTVVLDARMDEANMLVQLARALRLIIGPG